MSFEPRVCWVIDYGFAISSKLILLTKQFSKTNFKPQTSDLKPQTILQAFRFRKPNLEL